MKKLLCSVLSLLVINAFSVSCESGPTGPAADVLETPDLYVVAKRSIHLKRALAYGSSSNPNRYYLVDVQERKIDESKGPPGPTKRVVLSVRTLDASGWCSETELELTKRQFHWSMSKPWVNAQTSCGRVRVSWRRTGPVTTSESDYWEGPATCSPPEGQTSVHTVGFSNEASASASGEVGSISVPLSGDNLLNYASISHGKDTQTHCSGSRRR